MKRFKRWRLPRWITAYPGALLFISFLVVGFFSFDRYGLSWDEPMQRGTGKVNYDYAFWGDKGLETWPDKDYGPVFEVGLIAIEKALHLDDSREIYLMRHLVTHIFFLVGGYFFYLLVLVIYQKKWLAVIAFMLLVLHPRIYTHSFFNTKDIPFLAMMAISLYFLVRAFKVKTILNFTLLGICVGLLINMRIMGVMLLVATPFMLVLDMIILKRWKYETILVVIFIVFAVATLVATWPYLWSAPYENFLTAYANMSNFRWSGAVLLNGDIIYSTELPWYYLPEWFLISTPILILIVGFIGIGILIVCAFNNFKAVFQNGMLRNNLFFFALFAAPVIAVITLNSVVYDGWRQVFFIYVPFVLLITFALDQLSSKLWPRLLLVAGIGYSIGAIIFYFPYGNVYFNSTMDFRQHEYVRKNFETDYWGTSYVESLRYILDNDNQDEISIAVRNAPGYSNQLILKPLERARIKYVEEWEAQYYIADYRNGANNLGRLDAFKFYEVKRGKNTLNTVFKFR